MILITKTIGTDCIEKKSVFKSYRARTGAANSAKHAMMRLGIKVPPDAGLAGDMMDLILE